MEFRELIPYEIRITPSKNGGFIVNVGCCTCVYTSVMEMLEELTKYLESPQQVEKEYNNRISGCGYQVTHISTKKKSNQQDLNFPVTEWQGLREEGEL